MLKAQKDAETLTKNILNYITLIYSSAVRAGESGDTSYKHHMPMDQHKEFIPRVIDGLKELFPDCSVEFASLSRGADGKLYDISKMDEKFIGFINKQQTQHSIVIDWS